MYFTWLNGMGCEGYLKLLPKKSQWLSWGMGISVLFPFVCPPSSVISRFPHFPDVTPHYLDNGNGSNLQKHFRGRMLTIGLLAKNGRDGKSVSPPSEKARGGLVILQSGASLSRVDGGLAGRCRTRKVARGCSSVSQGK